MGILNAGINLYKILKSSQLDRDALETMQTQQLRRLLRHAVGKSEFYRDLYEGIDIENCRLQDLPVVTKEAMMDNYDRFVTDKRLKLHQIQSWLGDKQNDSKLYLGVFSPFLTSGSTGANAVITYHKKALEMLLASLIANYPFLPMRSISSHFRKLLVYPLKRPRAAVFAVPRGNIEPLFLRLPARYSLFNKIKIFSLLDPMDQIVEELNKFQPDQLLSHTFFIALLAQEQLAGRLKISFDHSESVIAGAGEVLTPQTQELARRAWNTKIQNTYGAMECYVMATSCRQFDQLHLMSHLCILEIVDRHRRQVPRGAYGEKILLTNLFNFTQPIIRYEIEDITGIAGESCQCGSPLPILLPVEGRTTDFFYFEKNNDHFEQLFPSHFHAPLLYVPEIRQYQIIQSARNELTFLYVPQQGAGDLEPHLRKILTEALSRKGLANHVMLVIKRTGSISRDERSGKYKPMVSMEKPRDL